MMVPSATRARMYHRRPRTFFIAFSQLAVLIDFSEECRLRIESIRGQIGPATRVPFAWIGARQPVVRSARPEIRVRSSSHRRVLGRIEPTSPAGPSAWIVQAAAK